MELTSHINQINLSSFDIIIWKKIFRDQSVYIVTYTSYTMHKALYTKKSYKKRFQNELEELLCKN